jgi:hypothetical protein
MKNCDPGKPRRATPFAWQVEPQAKQFMPTEEPVSPKSLDEHLYAYAIRAARLL